MNGSRELVLAGKSYKITTPLTLQQLIDLNIGMQSIKDSEDGPDSVAQQKIAYDRAIHVVHLALRSEYPELTEDALRNMRGTSLKEFNAATIAIYEESGLVARKVDGAEGEAKAE